MIIEHELHILENVKFALCMEIDVGKYTVWIRFFKDKIVLPLKLERLLKTTNNVTWKKCDYQSHTRRDYKTSPH